MITICQLLGALPLGLGGGQRWSSSAEDAPVGVFAVAGRQRLALGQPEIRPCSRTGDFSYPIFPRALRQHPAEVAVLRPELDAPGVIGPGLAALRAGAGQLLIPPDPAIAAIGKVSHIIEANPGLVLPPARARTSLALCDACRGASAANPARRPAPPLLSGWCRVRAVCHYRRCRIHDPGHHHRDVGTEVTPGYDGFVWLHRDGFVWLHPVIGWRLDLDPPCPSSQPYRGRRSPHLKVVRPRFAAGAPP